MHIFMDTNVLIKENIRQKPFITNLKISWNMYEFMNWLI
jgi:hypothetical protein